MTSLLRNLSEKHGIPLSTLKLNVRVLRELNLISYGSNKVSKDARLLALGKFVMTLLKGGKI